MLTLRDSIRPFLFGLAAMAVTVLWLNTAAKAAESKSDGDKPAQKTEAKDAKSDAESKSEDEDSDSGSSSSKHSDSERGSAKKPKFPPYAEFFKDADDPIPGLIKLRRKGGSLYAELSPGQLNKDFIVVISIARGIGHDMLLAGMSWNFGDDWIWQFRKTDDYIQVVRRNVRFTAAKGSPEERAVQLAYTDSVLFSLPIVTTSPSGAYVVDLNQVFMTDLPEISQMLTGFSFSSQRSTWATTKGFADNDELEVAATYASSGSTEIDSVSDTRGATINVHYSISYLPQNGYHPRLADDRVGYFLSVIKDYSIKGDEERFVRYINRWDLAKADPSADVSPPKKPIIFWLEKTIPYKYRAPVREGILEWNKAFEKAGFENAIEVRQQPDNADWDPEDINYNTFRWITSSAKFAMGPSRVNPTNGQILNASIIFDADFLQYWSTEYETFTPASIAAMTGGPLDLKSYEEQVHRQNAERGYYPACDLSTGRALDFALGSTVLMAKADSDDKAKTNAEEDRMIMQGLKEVTMHEVGHTLGLRHNFKASAYHSLEEINDPAKMKDQALVASVMDYAPAHIVPKGKTQGDYFSTTIGPYDIWAIEYGYTPDGEKKSLDKITSRSGEPALQYATDEDTRGIDSDPLVNRYDLGSDNIAYAKERAELIADLWPKIVDRVVKEGEGYEKAREAFGILLSQYGRAMYFASRYVGGVYVNRSHKGDKDAPAPYVVVDPKKQKEALELVEAEVFNDKPFQFPPDLYNHLSASRWDHWGAEVPLRNDYPVHEVISMWQGRILDQLLSSLTLDRLHDSELKVPADQDAFTTPDLIDGLTKSIFSELDTLQGGDFTNRKPAISSLRRNLQRQYLTRLANLAMGNTSAPADCQTVAFAELKSLQDRMNKLLASNVKLDDYTRDHLTESSARIGKVLDAHLQLRLSPSGGGIFEMRYSDTGDKKP
ncbi:MAG TPA: zinc-dependent metalloprotease [Pirellulales bacterium]|nr:zinc-dependent metalloprotease [Pirellulales bacterium]